MRSEQEIFDEVAKLCASPGYIHAIAYFCFRDNMILYSDEMKPEDMQELFSKNRLIRTETSTLIGLMLKSEIDFALPLSKVLQEYISSTESLLEELHHAIGVAFWENMDPTKVANKDFNPFTSGKVLREPIFYGGESAYSFQYRDFSPKKYAADDEWLVQNKGFSIQDATVVVSSIGRLLDEKAGATFKTMRNQPPDLWTFLPCMTFSATEVSEHNGLSLELLETILSAFTVPPGTQNEQFVQLNDYNIANANPLLRAPDGSYVLFHIYSLVEALYESPFYWMGADKNYVNTAMQNRGRFTEQFAVDRLSHVFGAANIYQNIDIYESKGKKIGEIDVLVFFGDRALVLQAKSKRLTLEARRGNDLQLRNDFKKSIQDSCDQAYLCADLVEERKLTLTDAGSNPIQVPENIKRIYVLCLISDHYPALSFQARQFLSYKATETIPPPFVLDVFALDAIAEMLDTPLRFLSYVDLRTGYTEKLLASHELTILSYHLKQNLWLEDEYNAVLLSDDISADLDVAMLVRRESIPGKRTPDGILTRLALTTLGKFVKDIEHQPDPATIDFGLTLLTLSEQTVFEVSTGIDHIVKQALKDGQNHDLTIGLSEGQTGLTIHCNDDPTVIAKSRLQRHCSLRKYTERAKSWFGICVRPADKGIRFGLKLEYEWEYDEAKEALVATMPKPRKHKTLLQARTNKQRKVGRNDPCPCGSGKKYKKCCLR